MIRTTKNCLTILGVLSLLAYLYWFTMLGLTEAYERGVSQGRKEVRIAPIDTTKVCMAWWFDEANRLNKRPQNVKQRAK